jgi:hypothetical protein
LHISAIFVNFLWQIFWYILGICTTELLFKDLKKVDFRVGTSPFWIFEKKVFSTKVCHGDDSKIIAGFDEGWVGADVEVATRTKRINKKRNLSL